MNKSKHKKGVGNEKWLHILSGLMIMLILISCSDAPKSKQPAPTETSVKEAVAAPKKKVLFVNSYHPGYDWSDGITQGILDTFGARLKSDGEVDNSASKVILKIFFMDTKRNKSEEFKKMRR